VAGDPSSRLGKTAGEFVGLLEEQSLPIWSLMNSVKPAISFVLAPETIHAWVKPVQSEEL